MGTRRGSFDPIFGQKSNLGLLTPVVDRFWRFHWERPPFPLGTTSVTSKWLNLISRSYSSDDLWTNWLTFSKMPLEIDRASSNDSVMLKSVARNGLDAEHLWQHWLSTWIRDELAKLGAWLLWWWWWWWVWLKVEDSRQVLPTWAS